MNIKLIFCSIFLILFSVTGYARPDVYTNVIIFGDSLSDLGNFPESQVTYFPDKKKPLFNIYVPVSNPVVLTKKNYTVPLTKVKQPYPKTNVQYLPKQPNIHQQPRYYRSISWSQYFVNADPQQLIASHTLIPWTSLMTDKPDIKPKIDLSVSYAWSGALSTDNCHNVHYAIINDNLHCNAKSILQSNAHYRTAQTFATWHDAQVPGVLKQIDLFKQDINHQRVAVGPNTLYIVWVGSNDLANAYYSLNHTSIRVKLGAIKNILYGAADNVYLAVKALITNPKIHAQHIVVFNLFDLALTPEAHSGSKTEKFLANYLTKYYNLTLSLMMKVIRHEHPNVSIKIANIHQWFNAASKSKQFKHTLGKMCQTSNPNYVSPKGDPNNCQHYLFWNAAHPSTKMEQLISFRLTKLLEQK